MKRNVQGLASVAAQDDSVPDGVYLVQVQSARHQWDREKPFYVVRFSVVAPKAWAGGLVIGRMCCAPKALWKLGWFLRDFGYDPELLERNEIDDKALIDLWGVIKVSEVTVHGISLLNFDGFAPAARWEELSMFADRDQRGSEVSS